MIKYWNYFVLRLHQVAASLRRLLTGGIQMSTSEGRQLLSILQILEVLNILTCIKFRYNKYHGKYYNFIFPLTSGIQRSTTEGIPVAHTEAASFHLADIGPSKYQDILATTSFKKNVVASIFFRFLTIF